jgi:hypothetical protein
MRRILFLRFRAPRLYRGRLGFRGPASRGPTSYPSSTGQHRFNLSSQGMAEIESPAPKDKNMLNRTNPPEALNPMLISNDRHQESLFKII